MSIFGWRRHTIRCSHMNDSTQGGLRIQVRGGTLMLCPSCTQMVKKLMGWQTQAEWLANPDAPDFVMRNQDDPLVWRA